MLKKVLLIMLVSLFLAAGCSKEKTFFNIVQTNSFDNPYNETNSIMFYIEADISVTYIELFIINNDTGITYDEKGVPSQGDPIVYYDTFTTQKIKYIERLPYGTYNINAVLHYYDGEIKTVVAENALTSAHIKEPWED